MQWQSNCHSVHRSSILKEGRHSTYFTVVAHLVFIPCDWIAAAHAKSLVVVPNRPNMQGLSLVLSCTVQKSEHLACFAVGYSTRHKLLCDKESCSPIRLLT